LPQVGRFEIDPADRGALRGRAARWIGAQLLITGLLSQLALTAGTPDLVYGLAIAGGLATAFYRTPLRAAASAGAVVGACVLSGLALDGVSTIDLWVRAGQPGVFVSTSLVGGQILAAGVTLGWVLGWLDDGPDDTLRGLQLALVGTTLTGVAWWLAALLLPTGLTPLFATLFTALVVAVGSAAVLLPGALRYRTASRIPGPPRIRSTLTEDYREPCLRAHSLDSDLAKQSPDPETRDGLGEVAAWIYRLQWTLQRLDREQGTHDDLELAERVVRLTEEAQATEDAFTRDRKLATVRHLERLQAHRTALGEERNRTAALVDYASAFLEEARGSLVLAQMKPGEQQTPERLDDVLGRLRTFSNERANHRRTAREVAVMQRA